MKTEVNSGSVPPAFMGRLDTELEPAERLLGHADATHQRGGQPGHRAGGEIACGLSSNEKKPMPIVL
ncbi:MAG: hypothetical protein V9H26_25235 [Verrucomicrobiota bacterium]